MPKEKDGNSKAAEANTLLIDARALAAFLVDLPPGATQGMSREQEGFAAVVHELRKNQKEWGAKAGISEEDVKRVETLTDWIAQIRAHLPAAKKLVEMLEESEAQHDDERHMLIREMANSVDDRSKRVGEGLLAKYEQTRAYRSAHAKQAAKTRAKNKAAKESEKKKAKGEAEPA